MNRYRKLPVEIEACQWDGTRDSAREIGQWLADNGEGHMGALLKGNEMVSLLIPTLEGTMEASSGDYIIKGVAGEFYPCKADIFEKTYEVVQ